jgi:hypothetical protein
MFDPDLVTPLAIIVILDAASLHKQVGEQAGPLISSRDPMTRWTRRCWNEWSPPLLRLLWVFLWACWSHLRLMIMPKTLMRSPK